MYQFVDSWITHTVYEIPDLYFLYALFGFVALVDLNNFLCAMGVTVCVNMQRKCAVYRRGYQHLFFSNIKSWKPDKCAPAPEKCTSWPADDKRTPADTRRVIFVRHGESEWNKVFNRGIDKGRTLIRIFLYPVLELLKFAFNDSYFYDSPLSDMGIDQCQELAAFLSHPTNDPDMTLAKKRDAADLRGDPNTRSIVVSSQLRRAVATAAIGLWPRLKKKQNNEKVLLLSSLMEQSSNFDCVPLSGVQEVPPVDDIKNVLKSKAFSADRFDPSGNMGDKPVRSKGKKGYDRMQDFLEFCFQPELQKTTIIAVGHSMYFRKFFNCFLDHDLDPKHYASDAKQYKLKNAAAVGLTLQRKEEGGTTYYRIHPDEINTIHQGFKK